jgi:pimeloyl-ACP methyl ester carboxylesterase
MKWRVALTLFVACLSPVAARGQGTSAIVEPGSFQIGGAETVPVELGRFSVPANRRRPESGTLTLRFVRFRSTAEKPGAPIVFLAGGPGDAATRAFRGMPRPFLDALRAIADVVAFDQRGTGTSEPRALCPPGGPAPLEIPLTPDGLAASLRDRLLTCMTRLAGEGVDVGGLTTEESADDVAALRIAIEAPQLRLLAGSYGTHLALAVARRHPSAVARMALLGVEGPDDTLKLPERIDGVLAEIDAAHPGLLASVRTLLGRLAETPWTKTLPNGQRVTVGAWDLQRRIAESLSTVRAIEALPAALAGMMDGDYSDLVRWTIPFRAGRPLNVMNLAMDCASFASRERLARVRAQAPASVLGGAMNFPLPDICDVPGLPRLDESFRAPLSSGVPALLVAGTWDGRTPPANARAAAASLAQAELLIVPRASHDLFQNADVSAALIRFLARP